MNDEGLMHAVRRAFDRYQLDVPVADVIGARTPRGAQRHRWTLVAVPALAAVLALAIVVQPVAPPEAVFASWTAVPGTPDPVFAAAAERQCRRAGPDPSISLPLVGQDRRGRAALAFFSDDTRFALCLVVNHAAGADGSMSEGVGVHSGRIEPLEGPLAIISSGGGESRGNIARMLAGQVTDEVARVDVVRDDGQIVRSTVSSGYFLAWWPGSTGVDELHAYDDSGELLVAVPNPLRPGADESGR